MLYTIPDVTITTSLYICFESWPMMTMFSTWQYEVKMEDVEAAEMVISMRLVVGQCQVWQQCTLRHQSPSTSGHQLNLSPAIQLCNTCTHVTWHVTCYVWLITQYMFDCQQFNYVTTDRGSSVAPKLCSPLTRGHFGMGKSANVVWVLNGHLPPIFWLDMSSRRRLTGLRLAQ